MTKVKGFKVFRPDWTCDPTGDDLKQYSCPGKFEEEGELSICDHGMHFCQNITDCFNYYRINSKNKFAEVIAYGEVITDGGQSCTDKLEIVREISWEEVCKMSNIGKNCTGYGNTGNSNTGIWNTGNWNTGNRNTGECNAGDYNTGYSNIGDWNTGDSNIGSRNTGKCNIGNFNIGDYNIGNANIGSWNKSSYNSGYFNTEEQGLTFFNKPSNVTYAEWMDSDARRLLSNIPKAIVKWVNEDNMTDEEKIAHPSYEITKGYLKVIKNSSENRQSWWDNLSDRERETIKGIPNFDAEIFFQCTGIKVNKVN